MSKLSQTSGGKVALLAMLSMLGLANSANAAEQWGQDFIQYVYPQGTGDFVIALVSNPAGCPSTENPKRLTVQVGHNGITADGAKALLATVLAAMAMNKQIAVNFSDTTTSCFVNRLMLIN